MEVSTKTLIVLTQNSEITRSVQFTAKKNLLELLNANNISISQSCGGNGTCTTCRILVKRNLQSFSDRTEIETERANERNFSDDERLACQCEVSDSVDILILQQE